MKDINTVFTQCPILRIEGGVKLYGVDVGSIWLVFGIIGAGVVTLRALAELVDKAIIIRSHWLTCKEHEERFRAISLKNDLLESFVDAHTKLIKMVTEEAADELARMYDITDQEEKNRIKLSLDYLEHWMQRGVEFYAAIGAPDEVKAVFPPVDKQRLGGGSPKYLEKETNDSKE